jgi:hypothetical protein
MLLNKFFQNNLLEYFLDTRKMSFAVNKINGAIGVGLEQSEATIMIVF